MAAERGRRRFVRRLRDPIDEWWPRGWALLLGLFLLWFAGTFVLAPKIQDAAAASVQQTLTDAGFEVLEVDASGQRVDVRLDAVGNPTRAREQAIAIARGSLCDSWAGALICPTRVQVSLSEAPPPAAPPAVDRVPVAVPRSHDFTVQRDGPRLSVSGEVADDETRLWLLASVRRAYPEAELSESLTVSGEQAGAAYRTAASAALAVLAAFERGSARWLDGRLFVRGLVRSDGEAAVREQLASFDRKALRPDLDYRVAKPFDRCAEAFRSALATSTINFETGSATIAADSQALLDALAELAAQCPGDLVVEGHTDSVGSDASNLTLSQNRAASVRDALVTRAVNARRVTAEGFGEAQPLASNETPEGRAANRRIVVRLADRIQPDRK